MLKLPHVAREVGDGAGYLGRVGNALEGAIVGQDVDRAGIEVSVGPVWTLLIATLLPMVIMRGCRTGSVSHNRRHIVTRSSHQRHKSSDQGWRDQPL